MKHCTIVLLVIFLTLKMQIVYSQTADLQFTVTNASSASACDGEMDIQCTGCLGPVNYTWLDSAGNIIGTGNHITGLCPVTNFCYMLYVDDYTCPGHFIYSLLRDATVAGNTFQVKTSLHYLDMTSNNYLNLQQVSGGVGTYNYYLYDDFDGQAGVTGDYIILGDSNLTSVTNIPFDSIYDPLGASLDFYTLITSDSLNYVGYYFTTILDSNLTCNNPPDPLWACAQGYPTSDSVICDAWAYAIASGGTAPYTYQFSSGAVDSTESGLCPGSYLVTVTDATFASFNTTFIVGYPGTFYFSDPGSYNYIDTLYSNAAASCGLDFSLPLDSFYVDSSYYSSIWMYSVDWVLWQDTNVYNFTETYNIDSTGCDYLFGLSVFCEARSANFGSFSVFSGLHVNPLAPNGVSDLIIDTKINISPNPSNGIYKLTSSSKMKGYVVFDQLGKKLFEKKIDSEIEWINLSKVNSGMYYLIVNYTDGSIGKQKLLKN